MGYEEFKAMLLEILQEKMGSIAEVRFETLKKNNGTEVEAVTFSGGGSITPAPYVKDLYELYQQQGGNKGFAACIRMIELLYASTHTIPDGRIFKPWNQLENEVKDHIMPALVNKGWNEEMLRDTPHREFLDLAVILEVPVFEMPEGTGTIRVDNDIVNSWGVGESELWDTAFCNLRREQFVVEDFEKAYLRMMKELSMEGRKLPPGYDASEKEPTAEETGLGQEHPDSEKDAPAGKSRFTQYLMTNSKKNYGAAGMLRTDLLLELTEKEECGLFILPSSIHEIILVPDKGICPLEELQEIVASVNRENVADKEKLSYNVYYFRKGGEKVEIA